MSSVTVDSKGQRLVTDVLIAGFTHRASKLYGMTIPNEIIAVIFMFWFIDICDEWDESLCHESVNIAGQCAKMTKNGFRSIFGKKCIGAGVIEWRLKLKTDVNWCGIGIIRDDKQTLIDNQNSNIYAPLGAGICLIGDGTLYLEGLTNSCNDYCHKFGSTGTLITITLNMDKKTITYKIDDEQYEPKAIPLSIDKYRLAVSFSKINDEIELL